MISIFTLQAFRSWVVIFHLRLPMAFLSFNLYDTPGLAPRVNVSFWGPGDFPVSYSEGYLVDLLKSWFSNRYGDLIQQYEVSLSRMLIKWHSDPWPTETSQPIRLSANFMTLIPNLTFIELRVVSMEHLQRMWHASRERLPSWHLVPFSFFGLACAPIVETRFLELAMSLLDFPPWIMNTPWYFLDFAFWCRLCVIVLLAINNLLV